ncbi:MAG TPA: DinB family protein [Thermoanaerobaculia bacterium]|nr:DinB family protein [Thermoanaerobaculia bacterium]
MKRRPVAGEYGRFYAGYVDLVPEEDILAAMIAQSVETERILGAIGDERAAFRYAPGKWSIREVVGHVGDSERVFGYRAMCIARGETNSLPGFDEKEYVRSAPFESCSMKDLTDALLLMRRANILLFRSIAPQTWDNVGEANETAVTVRALAYILVGHERHHLRVLRERYGV